MDRKTVAIQNTLIAGGINQVFDGTEWKHDRCILLCSNNQIFLYDTLLHKTRLSLSHHTKKVQCVRWLQMGESLILLSSSEDG